jgi:hypothetical protein
MRGLGTNYQRWQASATNICKGAAYSILWAKHTKASQVLPAGPSM